MITIRPVKSMIQFKKTSHLLGVILIFTLSASSLCGESPSQKQNRLFETFKNPAGENGIALEKAGLASVKQEYPIEIEVYKSDSDIRRIHGGYRSIRKTENGLEAEANLTISDSVSMAVKDIWKFSDPILSLERELRVTGHDDSGAFMSGITLMTRENVSRSEVDYFVPGMVYGSTDYLTPSAIGGRDTFESGSGQMWIREDRMPAPLFGVRFTDNTSIAVLNPAPDGSTTVQDSHDADAVSLIDERFRFGALGAEYMDGKMTCGFRFPGTEGGITYKGNTYPDGQLKKWRRRYHPLKDGLTQTYSVMFRFGVESNFPDFYAGIWHWAWETLQPPVEKQDIDSARYYLVKMLSDETIIANGNAGIPNYIASNPMEPSYLRDNHAVFGFTGKNLESAYYLLKDSYGDRPPDKFEQQKLGRAIIDSFVKLKMNPPVGEGFHIFSGEPCLAVRHLRHGPLGVYLRSYGDGMKAATRAYLIEKQHGVDHKDWLRWLTEYGEWLLTKQNPDGSFPRKFVAGTGEVLDPSPVTSYNVVPFLVLLSEASGSQTYLDSAVKAAEYAWSHGHDKGIFIGGTIDNPNVIDKEAGTLSLEAYLILYEKTKQVQWLDRARMAANFAESWIYIWNLPMPEEEDNSKLHWKKGVSTVGLQLISTGHTLVDDYMAYDADEYARLWAYTKDPHYYEVALILLHNTKNMMSLPSHPYDLNGFGWQQEHWSLAPPRGYGLHRGWLPWVSCSQLNGIYGIIDFDPELYKTISSGAKP